MLNTPTHNNGAIEGEIAKTVLMPGSAAGEIHRGNLI